MFSQLDEDRCHTSKYVLQTSMTRTCLESLKISKLYSNTSKRHWFSVNSQITNTRTKRINLKKSGKTKVSKKKERLFHYSRVLRLRRRITPVPLRPTHEGRKHNLGGGSDKIPLCLVLTCIAEEAPNVPEGQEVSAMNPLVTFSTQICIICLAIQGSPWTT